MRKIIEHKYTNGSRQAIWGYRRERYLIVNEWEDEQRSHIKCMTRGYFNYFLRTRIEGTLPIWPLKLFCCILAPTENCFHFLAPPQKKVQLTWTWEIEKTSFWTRFNDISKEKKKSKKMWVASLKKMKTHQKYKAKYRSKLQSELSDIKKIIQAWKTYKSELVIFRNKIHGQ